MSKNCKDAILLTARAMKKEEKFYVFGRKFNILNEIYLLTEFSTNID